MKLRIALMATVAAGTLLAAPFAAQAQYFGSSDSEFIANEKALQFKGARVGAYTLHPQLNVQEGYDDNVYALNSNEKDDWFTVISPRLHALSNFDRHQLNLKADADFGRYHDYSSEDYNDYSFAADGRIDLWQGARVHTGASYAEKHEDRGDPTATATQAEPNTYNNTRAYVGYYQNAGRLSGNVRFDYSNMDYDNNAQTNGTPIDNSGQNRDEYRESAELAYSLDPHYSVFTRGSLNQIDYDRSTDLGGYARSQDGYRVDAGVRAKYDMATGEVFAGYLSQEFDDSRLNDYDRTGLGYKVSVDVMPRTKLTSSYGFDIGNTLDAGASTVERDTFDVGVEHKIIPAWKVNVGYNYQQSDYQQSTKEETNETYRLGTNYAITDNVHVGARYEFRTRDSNVTGGDYDRNRVMVDARLGL